MIESVEMIIRQPGHPDRVVRLPPGATRLGRSEDCDVVLSDVGISRRHARVSVDDNDVQVEDLNSGNGTYYRGRRIDRQVLHDGDELIIDPFVLQFRIRGDRRPQRDDPTLDGPMARLDVVNGPGLARSSYGIAPRGLTIGRSETRDVVIPDPASSRHHCSVFFQDGQYILRDMGSANGVFVNGYRIKEAVLADGDRMQIGNTELAFVLDDATKGGGQPSSRAWDDHGSWSQSSELSLPLPEAPTPRAAQPRGNSGQWLSIAVGGATLFTFMALVMVVSGALLYVLVANPGVPVATTVPSGPPGWQLAVADPPADADVTALFDDGLAAMRDRDHLEALEKFYLSLRAEPNNPSAERFVYVAGEYVVLGAMEPVLDEAEALRLEREAERAGLLADVAKPDDVGEAAQEALWERFRDDPVVLDTTGWPTSEREKALQGRIADAADAGTREEWLDAVKIYEEVLVESQDPTLHKTARGGLKVGYRELAREVAPAWSAGVRAEAHGDLGVASGQYAVVRREWPENPSVRVRLNRLGLSGG